MTELTPRFQINWATVLTATGLILALIGGYATLRSNMAAAEARSEEKFDDHERRILDAEKNAKEMLVAIQGIRIDIAGMAADLRNLRQTLDRKQETK